MYGVKVGLVDENTLFEVLFQLGERYAFLFHRVAVAYRHTTVGFRVEVYRYAERCADFVLAAVAFADTACFVVFASKFLQQFVVYFRRFVAEFFAER